MGFPWLRTTQQAMQERDQDLQPLSILGCDQAGTEAQEGES